MSRRHHHQNRQQQVGRRRRGWIARYLFLAAILTAFGSLLNDIRWSGDATQRDHDDNDPETTATLFHGGVTIAHSRKSSKGPVISPPLELLTTFPLPQRENAMSSSSSSSSFKKMESPLGWWSQYVPNISRAYHSWNGTRYGWCHASSPVTETVTEVAAAAAKPSSPISGLIYVKSHKASSSTCEGITINIAHHVGHVLFPPNKTSSLSLSSSSASSSAIPCTHYTRHEFANDKGHGRPRHRTSSLLWTMVRHPSSRDLSHVVHFRVSRTGMEPTDDNLISALSQSHFQGHQVRYLFPSIALHDRVVPQTVRTHPERVAHTIQQYIFKHYDFIGVTERMEESLAVLTLLWGLDAKDVVVLPAKRSGGYDAGGGSGGSKSKMTRQRKCTKLQTVVRTSRLESFFQSDLYQSGHADFLLYHTAVASLDRTIEELGMTQVQERTKMIRHLQQVAESHCSDHAHFPCSPNGTLQLDLAQQSCYVQDAGCGHQCVDEVLSSI